VIVYVEPRIISQPLAAFLAHNLVKAGGYRYLHVAVDTRAAASPSGQKPWPLKHFELRSQSRRSCVMLRAMEQHAGQNRSVYC